MWCKFYKKESGNPNDVLLNGDQTEVFSTDSQIFTVIFDAEVEGSFVDLVTICKNEVGIERTEFLTQSLQVDGQTSLMALMSTSLRP